MTLPAADADPTACDAALSQAGVAPPCNTIPGRVGGDCWMTVVPEDYYHQVCEGADPYKPVLVNGCVKVDASGAPVDIQYFALLDLPAKCAALHASDPSWRLAACACCCCCVGYGASLALETGTRPIARVEVGDRVLAGRRVRRRGGVGVVWEPRPATFSSGLTAPSDVVEMDVAFPPSGTPRLLSFAPDQVLLRRDGKLERASRIRAGDRLLDAEARPALVRSVRTLRSREKSFHQVAVGAREDADADGHLLIYNGVVAGDYLVKLRMDMADLAGAPRGRARSGRGVGRSRTRTRKREP